jgi:hypothetical protein
MDPLHGLGVRSVLPAVVVATATAIGCGTPPPEGHRLPTEDQVIITRQAAGIPYDRFILLRDRDRVLALAVSARSPRGDHIGYRWWVAAGDLKGPPIAWTRSGEGEASEVDFTGTIDLPGLRLSWSRGSSALGWIYWPEDRPQFAVYSRPWSELIAVNPASGDGKWLRKMDFPG